jgi:hypothetical protein
MIRFVVDFTPHPFEKRDVNQTIEDMRERLSGRVDRLKVILKKHVGNQISFKFVGEPETVETAKRLLGIY